MGKAKCVSLKLPKCKIVFNKKCKAEPKCKAVWDKVCTPEPKSVSKTVHDKQCEKVYEEVCKDVKIRVVPDAEKYDSQWSTLRRPRTSPARAVAAAAAAAAP